jgi:hypothetical protein
VVRSVSDKQLKPNSIEPENGQARRLRKEGQKQKKAIVNPYIPTKQIENKINTWIIDVVRSVSDKQIKPNSIEPENGQARKL